MVETSFDQRLRSSRFNACEPAVRCNSEAQAQSKECQQCLTTNYYNNTASEQGTVQGSTRKKLAPKRGKSSSWFRAGGHRGADRALGSRNRQRLHPAPSTRTRRCRSRKHRCGAVGDLCSARRCHTPKDQKWRVSKPEIEDRLNQLSAEIDRLNTNNSQIEDELRVRSEGVLSANFKETDRKRVAGELKAESTQIANASSPTQPLPPSLAILQSEIEFKQIELEHNRKEVERYKKLLDQGLVGEQIYDRAVAEVRLSDAALRAARARLDAALVDTLG